MAELVYLDETGSTGRGANGQRYLTLLAVVVDESAVKSLETRLEALTMRHLGWVPADFEWHGYELWNGSGRWGSKSHAHRLAAFEDVIGTLPELSISVVHATIDKVALASKYGGSYDGDAYLLALQFLLEKLDRWRGNEVRRILIADEAKQHQLRAVKMVRDLQRWSVGVVPGRQLKSIIDSIHFVDSKSSPGVQLADMTAFVLQRRRSYPQPHPALEESIGRMAALIRDQTPTWREAWP
jgi:hypothetical protein